MGLLEEIDKLQLSDDDKNKLRAEYGVETSQSQSEIDRLRRRDNKAAVEREVEGLKKLFGEESPGLLKYTRRVLLSDDQQPSGVLLSDDDLELEGDERTGARNEEDVTMAGVLREFIKLIPRNADGKLALSDQALLTDDHGRPGSGDDKEERETQASESRKRVESALGRPIARESKRSQGMVS